MIRLRWFLLLLALSTLFATWRAWWVVENRSAESLLEAAESRLESHGFDRHVALRELDLALSMAEEHEDHSTAERALRCRAEVNCETRNHFLTLRDCDRLLQNYCPQDPEVLDMAARAAFAIGELDLAADYANFLAEVQPDNPASHNLVAAIHRALAEDSLQEIFRFLDADLPTRRAREGLRSARRAASLAEDDPHARSALEQLDSLSSDEEVQKRHRALALRARAHYRAARQAWLAGMEVERTGEAIQGLQEVLARAGQQEEVISLGCAALRRVRFGGAGGVLVRTALAQFELGQVEAARKLISDAKADWPEVLRPARLDDETMVAWLSLLHELELWPDLLSAVDVVRSRKYLVDRDKSLQATLPYLRGVALFELNRVQAAMTSLTRAGRYSNRTELIKGEQVLSWSVRATAERRMAMRSEELRSLEEVTRVLAVPEPDGSRAARAFGEALERQARLNERKGKLVAALEALARATAYLPERREELESRWRRLGERALESENRTLQELSQLFGLQRNRSSDAVLNSWATVELARRALDHGEAARAASLLRLIQPDLPYFPPLLEVAGEAYAAIETWERAVSTWLTLGRLFGYTDELGENLSRVPRNRIPSEDLITWAGLDPRRALLSGMVRDLVEEGKTALALQAIDYLGGSGTTPQEYLLAAKISAADRKWRAAYTSLEHIPNSDPIFPEAAALMVRSAVELGNPRDPQSPLFKSLAKVHGAESLTSTGFPEVIDTLLARGLAPEARALSRLLASREGTRDSELMLRSAVTEVSLGDVEAAEDALRRAGAFRSGPEALIGSLLLALDQKDDQALERASFQLIVGPFQLDPLREGITRALYGDLERALPLLAAADQTSDGLGLTAHLAFLVGLALLSDDSPESGTGDAQLDRELSVCRERLAALPEGLGPREFLALLLAIESEPWAGWAATRLVQAAPALAHHEWALMLTATTSAKLGRLEEAQRLAQRLTKPQLNMPWAWVLLEQIALERSGGEIDFEVVRARVGRALAIGARGLNPEETPKLAAEVLLFLRRPAGALRILELGLRREGQRPEVVADLQLSIARTATVAGRDLRALEAYDQTLKLWDRDFTRTLVPEILDLLQRLKGSHRLTGSAYFARLQSLAAFFPQDPAPVRAIARYLLRAGDTLSSSPVSRALARLDRFRKDTRNAPLERLRRGEATRWVRLVAELDPIAAEELAHAELLAAPFRLELWRTWADTLRGIRRFDQALGVFRTLAAVVPDTSAMKSLARVLLEQKEDPRLALAAATQARARLKDSSGDSELALIEAIAKTYLSERGFKDGVRDLRRLLRMTSRKNFPLEYWQVAKPLVEVLNSRGRRQDLKLVEEISLQAAEEVAPQDDLRADWFRAMGQVAHQDLR